MDDRGDSEAKLIDPDEAVLWTSWQENRDHKALSTLVDRYIPLVGAIARSVYRSMNPGYVDLRDLQLCCP